MLRLPEGRGSGGNHGNARKIIQREWRNKAMRTENRKRPIIKKVAFTNHEYAQVRRAMEQMNAPTFQYYAKNQIIQGKVVRIDFSELKNLRVAVNRIGGNINQIAKHANENQAISQKELSQVLQHLDEIKELISVQLSHAEKRALQERKRTVRSDVEEW